MVLRDARASPTERIRSSPTQCRSRIDAHRPSDPNDRGVSQAGELGPARRTFGRPEPGGGAQTLREAPVLFLFRLQEALHRVASQQERSPVAATMVNPRPLRTPPARPAPNEPLLELYNRQLLLVSGFEYLGLGLEGDERIVSGMVRLDGG